MKKLTLLLLVALSVFAGCIERKLTITSEPSGALVFISDKEIGRTPLTTHFTWHGVYDVILRYPEKGYAVKQDAANLGPEWYEVPPLDLLSIMAPWTYKDHRYLHYKLDKAEKPTDQQLIERATAMQKKNEMPVKK